MKYLILILLFSVYAKLYAQKPSLTIQSSKEWPAILRYDISNDGKHVWFITMDKNNGWVLHIKSSDTAYRKEIRTGLTPQFTPNSRYCLYKVPVDTLFIEDLHKHATTLITGVSDFSVSNNEDETWIAYRTYKDNSITIKSLSSGAQKSYEKVTKYLFNPQGSAIVVQAAGNIIWLSLTTLKEKIITQDTTVRNINFSPGGDRIVFANGRQQLNYYQEGMDTVSTLNLANISAGAPYFSSDGNTIFYYRRFDKPLISKDSAVVTNRLNIWHYKDEYLQEHQLRNLQRERRYITAFSTALKDIIRLESPDTSLILSSDHYALIQQNVNIAEKRLKKTPLPGLTLVSLLTGLRTEVKQPGDILEDITISPDERFITWFDTGTRHYYSYEISTGILLNISKRISFPISDRESSGPYGTAGWREGKGLLVYDRFDIWLIDPSNKLAPVNITNGYGRRNNTVLRNATTSVLTDTLLLAGFNTKDKQNGYFWLRMDKTSQLILIIFGPYLYYFPPLEIILSNNLPVKAKYSNIFLTKRTSATSFPNLFLVNERHQQIPLTAFEPQLQYNWLTAELIHWKQPDGVETAGILYKPENFDPRKKYPIIFNYYEKKSNGLHNYPQPGSNNGGFDIARYVSNGYLVLLPDIHYKQGQTGESALRSITSAANYLATFPWVNKHKMGLQGHSFGGYETNYIITHSNLFAAAQEGAGSCNLISAYGYLTPSGDTRHELYEKGQGNLGTTPWTHPDIYIKNSPIFNVHKVTTPLLMMHNKEDSAVPFAQAIEFFTALRRENKKVWLLQYDNGSHTLDGDPDIVLDFSIRQQQFFDHYLKDSLPPLWMTQGVPASGKGIISGLGLDTSGRRP